MSLTPTLTLVLTPTMLKNPTGKRESEEAVRNPTGERESEEEAVRNPTGKRESEEEAVNPRQKVSL
jgi:hypothetical protein